MISVTDTLRLIDAQAVINSGKEISRRPITVPRASGIGKDCIRMRVLMTKSKQEKSEELSFGDRLTFGWGNSLHYMAQNTDIIIKDKYRRGWYRCTACNKIQGFGGVPSQAYTCKFCNARREAIVYHEHSMKVEGDPFYLTGHMDLFVELELKILTVTEFKSMAASAFKALEKPLAEHVMQATSYMIGLPHDKSKLVIPKSYTINTESAIIIYITKEALAPGVQAYKAFRVRRNKMFEGIIVEKLEAFKDGYENFPKKLPSTEGVCAHNRFQSPSSKACPAVNLCKKYYFEGHA